MDVTHLLTQTVTITHVVMTGAVDKYGNPTEVTTTSTFRGHLQPPNAFRAGDEATVDRDTQIARRFLFLELAANGLVDGGDRATVDAVTYELEGPPSLWHNPQSRRVEYLQVQVIRVV